MSDRTVSGRRSCRRYPTALAMVLLCAAFALPPAEAQEAAASTPPATAEGKATKPKPAAGDKAAGEKGDKDKADKKDAGFLGELSPSSSNEPIVVHSDELEFDYQANKVIYRGSVNVVQGELKIDCKELLVNLARSGEQDNLALRDVVAIGDVVITQGNRTATGGRAIFDQQKRQITLLENPVLHDGPNEVTGERLVVYMDEGRSVVESSAKKRVSAILYPGKGNEGGVDLAAQDKDGAPGKGKPDKGKAKAASTPQPGAAAPASAAAPGSTAAGAKP
jgi:lipopolysaccharide export system protein LptA